MTRYYPRRVSPFGHPRIIAWLAAPRGLSQLPTSFIASRHLGIRRTPLVAWPPTPLTLVKDEDAQSRLAMNAFTFAVNCAFPSYAIFKERRSPTFGVPQRVGGVPGGAGRNRTDDPLLAKQVLYQLSYSPEFASRPST